MNGDTPLCGVCGRTLGRFRVQRGPAWLNTWRHTGDVAGLVPHVATIGAPGRRATVEEMTAALGDADAARDLWDQIYGVKAKPRKIHRHLEEIPAPRIPARPASEEEIPRAAELVRKVAVEHGWEVRAVYAIGPLLSESYEVLREVESLSLRMHRGGQRVVAVWQKPWSSTGAAMVTKRKQCPGCRKLDCQGCALGTGATVEELEAKWEHDISFVVTPTTALVRLTDLKAQLTSPEAYCQACTEVLGNHIPDPERGYICPKQEANVR